MENKTWLYVILTCIFELFWVFGFNTAQTLVALGINYKYYSY